MKEHFDTDAWRKGHEDKTIKQIVMHWVGQDTIERPSFYEKVETEEGSTKFVPSTKNHEVSPLVGITKHYSYRVVSYERIAMRRYSCWCNTIGA